MGNHATRESIGARLRFDILRRCNFACYYCGVPAAMGAKQLHVDHIIPAAMGGTNDPWNLVAACAPCNLGKAAYAPPRELIKQVRAEWLTFASPHRGRPTILCAHCGIPVVLAEGDEAVLQCDTCLEIRIAAYLTGQGSAE